MTGAEAWNLIAPILGQYVDTKPEGGLTPFGDAYLVCFWALKQYDEKRAEKK